jgi:transketolase
MADTLQLHRKTNELCKLVVRMTTTAGSGHPSSGLSLAHIVTALMYETMRYDPQDPWNPSNDRLVLSEGHAVPIIYAAYADLNGAYGKSPEDKKILTVEELDTLRQIGSSLDGHPNPPAGFPFFDNATGSLGQGLSCGCGLALAARVRNIDKRIFVLIGDGESREGQIWEACDFVIDYNLHEVLPIFNCNGQGQSDYVSHQQSVERVADKLNAYGFVTKTIDGHDPEAISKALDTAINSEKPHAIVAKTVKGWGVEEFQRSNYHGKPLKEEQLDEAMADLDRALEEKGISDMENPKLTPPKPASVTVAHVEPGKLGDPDFESILDGDKYLTTFKKGKMSTRRAYGLATRELGKLDSRIVVIDGDVKNSTFSDYFFKSFPNRSFEGRIAEQNIVSVAAGLAAGGMVPFAATFAKFFARAYDQIELALLSGVNIKLTGSHSGANIGPDGPSQMGLLDVSYFRSFSTVKRPDGHPLMVCFNPACGVAAYKCVQLMAEHPGSCYMRTLRADLPILYPPSEEFEIGGAKTLRQGKDVVIMAAGYMVHTCLKIAQELSATLIDCYSIPMKPEIVADAAKCGRIVTVEDNYGNSLGSEVAAIVAADPKIDAVVKQLFVGKVPKSGKTADDILEYVGLGADDIKREIKAMLK